MLRLILIALACCGCAGAGLLASARLRERAKLLACLRADIRRLALLMGYAAEPLQRLALRVADGEAGAFWRAFAERIPRSEDVRTAFSSALRAAEREHPAFRSLGEPERQILLDYAAGLGISDRETQAANARLLEERLAAVLEEAREEYARKGRMYRAMGLLSGMAAAILVL